jgi:hypothetical protein
MSTPLMAVGRRDIIQRGNPFLKYGTCQHHSWLILA